MKYVARLLMIWLTAAFLTGCLANGSAVDANPASNEFALFVSADTTASSKPSDSEPITKISWKVIDYGGSPYFHLYVTLNNKADYYVGYFYGENFETGEFIDTPANVLTAASAEWTGMGELFYIYQKSKTELAMMNHYVSYMTPPDEREEYQEILTLPIEKGSEIEVGDVLYVNVPYCWSKDCAFIIYDSFVLGGLDRSSELIPISEKSLEEYWHTSGDWGFRLFQDGQYLDTVSYHGFDETWLRNMVTESNDPVRTDSMRC